MPQLKPPNGMTEAAANEAQAKAALGRSVAPPIASGKGYAVSGRVQAHRGGVWLEQGDRRLSQDPPLRPRPRQLDVHVDDHCL
jgi:hypothetical protein